MNTFRKYAVLSATLLLCGLLFSLLLNKRQHFREVEENYAEYRAINLQKGISVNNLSALLLRNGYVANDSDAFLIADTVAARLERYRYPTLYHLQKRAYGQIPASVADSDNRLTEKLKRSCEVTGQTDDVPLAGEIGSELKVSSGNQPANDGKIFVQVYSKDEHSCSDIVVRLTEYYIDSVDGKPTGHESVIGYAKTDSLGQAVFTGLDYSRGYSVLPIKRGWEYGTSKGIVQGTFDKYKYFGKFTEKKHLFRFEQQEHLIRMLDDETLKQIKHDGTITVRTPHEYKTAVVRWFVLVLLAWWVLAIILVRRGRNFDPVLLASSMFLSCLCVLVMFAIQDPLTEELRGPVMGVGVLAGVGVIGLLQLVDFVKLYQNNAKMEFDIPLAMVRWLLLPFKRKVAWLVPALSGDAPWYKKLGAMVLLAVCLPFAIFNIPVVSKINKPLTRLIDRLPKGSGWLIAAIFLTMLLWTPLGCEIGGMKVNLNISGITFQPSEIAKYLILLFMAAFFTQNADTIIAYSRPGKTRLLDKIKTLGWVIGGILLLMAMYAALGDLGPALVIGITFVILYSLVKSKVNLDNLTESDKWERIFTCDFAVMIYGVLSFTVVVASGFLFSSARTAMILAALWFVLWVLFGIAWHRQFFETAFVINMLVFVFIFGGDIARQVPILRDTDVAERFEQRTNMCTNTWGDLDIHPDDKHYVHGANATPVSNTQVANGLWAIATGGLFGQGVGNGNPNLVPAFHTDMILSSIAEQTGWWGLAFIVLVMALLLRRIIVTGYRAGHPFAFYFCMGVAVVTAVQFFIIALGSSGIIPLTGITVPFLSFGRVSMILNLAALGIVMSLAQNIRRAEDSSGTNQVRQRSVWDYNYPVSVVTWVYVILAVFTLGVWQFYAWWNRSNTLTRPVFAYSREGMPLIEYNPRIALLTQEMRAGNIYDRNGVLLATSDPKNVTERDTWDILTKSVKLDTTKLTDIVKAHTKRYYPFAEHLFFMVGDLDNTMYSANEAVGYMAEARHMSYLRDFDNLHDRRGNPTPTLSLAGRLKAESRYLPGITRDTIFRPRMRDYHELVPCLKHGVTGRALRKHNEAVSDGKFDIHLTIDAKLQTEIQRRMQHYVEQSDKLKNDNLLRISVVVLDAEDGDLLTSAVYPLPDYQRLREEAGYGYTDNYKDAQWHAWSDRDLGLMYQTMPGSTAKVMSAMAGLNKLGVSRVRNEAVFPIYRYEVIDINYDKKTKQYTKSKEPPKDYISKTDLDMRGALVQSSNCYFINLINKYDCYDELENIYAAAGISLNNKQPYSLHYSQSDVLHDTMSVARVIAENMYQNYVYRRDTNAFREGKDWKTMKRGEWMWAWGQGSMGATPLSIARVASAVVNNGQMPVTKYLMTTADKKRKPIEPQYVPLTAEANARELRSYMHEQAQGKGFASCIGGKTGTPERNRNLQKKKGIVTRFETINDAWYMFFVEKDGGTPPLAVAIRMERTRGQDSRAAMQFAKSVVLEALKDNKYVNLNN